MRRRNMTDRFEEVKQLKRIETLAKSEPIESMYYWGKWKYHMTVSYWLVEVARCFQPEDTKILRLMRDYLAAHKQDGRLTKDGPTTAQGMSCVSRLLQAAEIMEEK